MRGGTLGGTGRLRRSLNRFEQVLSQLFYRHGVFCASYPYLILLVTAAVVFTLSYPVICHIYRYVTDHSYEPQQFWESPSSRAPIEEELFIEKFGTEPFLRLEQVVINASDTRRKYQEGRGPGVLDKVLLIYALEFQQNIARAHVDLYLGEGAEVGSPKTTGDRNAQFNKGMQTFRLNDICYKPFGDGRCLIHSPLEYWASDIERLKADPNVRRTLSNASTLSSFNMPIPLRSVFGGVVWEQQRIWSGWSGIAGAGQGSGGDSQSFAAGTVIGADSIVITYFLEDKLDGNKRLPKKSVVDAWDGLVREAIRNMKSGSIGRRLEQGQQTPTIVSWRANAEVKHLYYKFGPRFQPLEAETLVLGVSYLLVFLYISLVMGKVDLVKSRFGLGFAAVMMVLSSLFMSVGLWTMLGVRTSLVPWEVLPFLIMAVGVENILVLTNAVVSTKLDLPVKERVGLGLSKVGVRMSLSLGGEMFFLLIGSVINIRALQEFCLFAAVSIVIDYFMQITFFACVLSLDIRRLELSDLYRLKQLPAQRPSPSIPTQTTKTMSRGINDKTFAHWLQEKACSWSAVLTLGIMAFLGFGLYGSSSEGSIIIPSDLSLWEDSMAAAADAFWNIINPSKSDKYVEIQPPTYMTFVYSADSTSSTEPDYFRDQKISTDGGTNDDGSRMVDWDLLVLMASVVFVLNCTILSCIFLTSTVQWFSRRRISAEQSKQSQTSSTWQHKSINAMYWKASRHWDVEILHVAEDGTISWSCLDGKIHTRNCRTGWWATIADDLSKQHGQPSSLCYEPKKNIMVLGTKGGSIVVFLMEHKRVYALPLDIGVGGRQHPNGGGLLEIIRKTAPPVFVSASGIPDKPIFVVTLSEMRVLRLVFDEDGAPLSQVLVHKVNLRESGAICTAFLGYASDGLILGWQDGLVEILEQDDASLSMSSSPLPSSPPSPVLSPAETHVGFDHRNANDGFGAYFVNIRQLQGHKCAVTSLATENDHGLLATGDADGVIKVWDIHSGAELACIGAPEELEGDETEESTTAEVFHEAEITFLKFWRSGDMLLLISASKDETVLILEVTTSPLEESLYDMSVLGSNRRATGLSYPTVTTSGFPKADHSRTPTPTTPPVVGSIFMKVVYVIRQPGCSTVSLHENLLVGARRMQSSTRRGSGYGDGLGNGRKAGEKLRRRRGSGFPWTEDPSSNMWVWELWMVDLMVDPSRVFRTVGLREGSLSEDVAASKKKDNGVSPNGRVFDLPVWKPVRKRSRHSSIFDRNHTEVCSGVLRSWTYHDLSQNVRSSDEVEESMRATTSLRKRSESNAADKRDDQHEDTMVGCGVMDADDGQVDQETRGEENNDRVDSGDSTSSMDEDVLPVFHIRSIIATSWGVVFGYGNQVRLVMFQDNLNSGGGASGDITNNNNNNGSISGGGVLAHSERHGLATQLTQHFVDNNHGIRTVKHSKHKRKSSNVFENKKLD